VLFNSLTFVVFFAVVLALHHAPWTSWRVKKIQLLLASYLFYAAWNPPFVVLLWISTFVDWHVAKRIHAAEGTTARRGWVLVSVAVNLGILGYFKYGGFLLANWVAFMGAFGVEWQAPAWSIVLPVGISFYTFQTMAYSLDVYLRRAAPAKSLLDFGLFVTFFPQLVAGPIVRPTDLVPQFASQPAAKPGRLAWGLSLMVLGMFEKIVIADGALAPAADAVFGASDKLAWTDAWLGTLAFSGQIFCDFAGYSTTAIGAALALGFSLPDNFRFPYAAVGFSDFWRRWHVSLSTWLRDYLYVPLGGNRKGPGRTYVNLMLTMLLGGLWHGASWTFVVWGGLHGTYLAVERFLRERVGPNRWSRTLPFQIGLAMLTYFLVNLTWVFFRARTFETAWRMTGSMLTLRDGARVLTTADVALVVVPIFAILLVHGLMRDRRLEDVAARAPWWVTATVLGGMVFTIVITQGSNDAFIYFQF
jgi:alginate O-acetyltransferase complex protein AlgI